MRSLSWHEQRQINMASDSDKLRLHIGCRKRAFPLGKQIACALCYWPSHLPGGTPRENGRTLGCRFTRRASSRGNVLLLSYAVLRCPALLRLPAPSPCVSPRWMFGCGVSECDLRQGKEPTRIDRLWSETATRAKSCPRMGMPPLHRLIILMAYFIRRLGGTGTVVLMAIDLGVSGGISYSCRLSASGRRIDQFCVSGKAVGTKSISSITRDAIVFRIVVSCVLIVSRPVKTIIKILHVYLVTSIRSEQLPSAMKQQLNKSGKESSCTCSRNIQ
jgi:hypothetical protein